MRWSYQLSKCFVLWGIMSYSYANGFYIPQQNITNLGTSYAGVASLAEDASINFHNAAGLTRLPNRQFVAGLALADSNTLLQVDSATDPLGVAMVPDSTKPDAFAMIPSFHYGDRLNNQWSWGFSVVSTYGSKTNYAENSIARYMGTKSEMITIDFSPSLAYKINNRWSIGAGLDAFYVHAKLHKALNFGATDGFNEDRGRDIAPGMHIGFLYELNNKFRVGLSYRSNVKVKLKGTSTTKLHGAAAVTHQDVKTDINFPDMAILSGFHQVTDRWAIMGDIQWINWSRIDKITLRYQNGGTATLNYDYRDSYRFALGGAYQYNDHLKFKFGTAYDKTPSKDSTRNIAVPDQDQTAFGFGFQYVVSKDLTFDVAYAHIFAKKAVIRQNAAVVTAPLAQTNESIVGHTKQHINVLGLQVIWNIL